MTTPEPVLVATGTEVLAVGPSDGTVLPTSGLGSAAPTALAVDPAEPERCWCGTARNGVFASGDGGRTWAASGLEGRSVMSLAASPARTGRLWAGTEPSAMWRSDDAGGSWEATAELAELASSGEWSFPPRPETHHVRWIACHPREEGRLWVAIEAGALVSTTNGGQTWRDRAVDGPRDTHELAIHPERPETLRVSAGDGYFESHDAGTSWGRPREGLEVGYLRSVAVDPGDPDVVVVSASSGARTAYVAGRSDGRMYRRSGTGRWERVTVGWPDPPRTIAPLVRPGGAAGELWAADERGLHRSRDGGRRWERVVVFDAAPTNLRGLALLRSV